MAHTAADPYVTDRPVGKDMPFYGREVEFDWVQQSCLHGERVLILHGPPRIGKTSFLYQLPYKLPTDFSVIYIDLQTEVTGSEDSIDQDVAQALVRSLDQDVVTTSDYNWHDILKQSGDVLADILLKLEEKLEGRHLILALDGVDALLVTEEHEAALWKLVDKFRFALNRCTHIHLLWAGDGADRLQGTRSPRFERASVRRLGSLSMNAASSLVIGPARDAVSYEPPAVRRIIELASGHPYYIQLVCQAIYNDASESSWTVSLRDVERVVDKLLSGNIEEFEMVWEDSTTSEQIVLTALGTIRGNHGVSTRQEVGNTLRRENINVTQEEVTDNLEYLAARGVLERLGAMTYRFRVDLMRSWLRRRKSIAGAASMLGRHQRSEDVGVRTLRNIVIGAVGLVIIVVLVAVIWWPRGAGSPTSPVAGDSTALVMSTEEPTPFSGPTPTSTPHPTPTRLRIRMRSLPTIAYFARQDQTQPWQIWVMGSDGKDAVRITDSQSNETSPVWSPDGSQFVYVSERNGNRELYLMNSNGQNDRRLTEHPADDWMPVWAPDGETIAFVSRRYGNWDLFTIKPDGSELTRLTETPQWNNWTPAYSPDGQEMAFASNRDGDWELYIMNSDGSMPVRITESPGNDFSPAWSPRGDKIVFESSRDGNAEIYIMNSDGSEQVNLSRAPIADDHWPCWSPDGSHVGFQSNRDDGWDIYVVTAEGTNLTNLTRNLPGSEQGPHWRP